MIFENKILKERELIDEKLSNPEDEYRKVYLFAYKDALDFALGNKESLRG